MTRRRPTTPRRLQTGDLPSVDEIADLDYAELVAASCAMTDHMCAAADFTDAFCALQPQHWALMDRLTQLGEDDPRVVRAVAAALARPRAGHRVRGDLDQAEAALALDAHRHAMVLTDTGTRRRGPFARL